MRLKCKCGAKLFEAHDTETGLEIKCHECSLVLLGLKKKLPSPTELMGNLPSGG